METNFKLLKKEFFNKEITQRQFITYIKLSDSLQKSLNDETSFLDNYDNVSIVERIYYIINKKTTAELCPYCGNKRKFTGRIKEGYYPTCCSKECKSRLKSIQMVEANKKGHDNLFDEYEKWESNLTEINDDIIKKEFFFDKKGLKLKLVDHIKSKKLLEYMNARFKDSDSITETLQRINLKIEEKPKCPVCGRPVTFIGRPNHMFSTYCSTSCAANDPDVIAKKQASDMERNGGILGWVKSNSSPEKIEKRKETLNKRYGTTTLYKIPEVRNKIRETNMERYGVPFSSQNDEIKKKMRKSIVNSMMQGTSKPEEKLYNILKSIFPLTKHHYTSKLYPFNCDFYIPEKDVYIEYQGSQFHHFHPFDAENPKDIEELNSLKEKDDNIDRKNQYGVMIKVWTVSDPLKRKTVKDNNLNFLELWNLDDIDKVINKIDSYPNLEVHNPLQLKNSN